MSVESPVETKQPLVVPPMQIGPYSLWPPIFPAPMCGISDRPWRQFAREQGCPLTYTQMVSSEAMRRNGRDKCWQILDMQVEEQPVCAQLFGSEPEALASGAADLERAGAAIVDLNMGCPVDKVVRTNGGSALMRQPDLVRDIFIAIRSAIKVPFTVKFRAGWEKYGEEAFAVARIAQEEGLDAICIHARTREQKFRGNADWTILGALKKEFKIPVIGNGDVKCADSAEKMFREQGVDGAMIGRGAMGNPWVLGQIAARLSGKPDPPAPTVDERLDIVLRHAQMMCLRKGEERGLIEFRKHVVQYLRAFPYAREMKMKLLDSKTFEEYAAVIRDGRASIRELAAAAEAGEATPAETP